MKHTLICLIAAIAALISPQVAQAAQTEISASGTGSISLPPDIAIVRATLETNAATATEATSQNNALYASVISALEKVGVSRQDISLNGYNVAYLAPNAPRVNLGYVRSGYTVERGFSITVRELGKAGLVTDACLGAGATGILGISFGLSDEGAARAKATARAVSDARAAADTLAKAGRLHIVGIKAMQLGAFPGLGALRAIAHVSAYSGMPTQLDRSNVNVTVDVGVVFLAKP